jgi:uncharacterized protein DUF1552
MSFITRKHLSRRTLLRGVGVSLSLPLLDSMVPAQTPLGKTAAASKTRLGCIYVPHGAILDKWTPATEGTGFEFTEILKPLEPFRDRLNVISNLAHPQAGGVESDAGADHVRSAAVFLSGAHPEKGIEAHAGMTLDQLAAQRIGQDTPLPSLELSIEDVALTCGSGYGCAYMNTISWRTPTLPLPMENNPQVVFEKLFGDGANNAERAGRKKQARSLLDSLTSQVASLQKELPPSDRARIAEYLDDIREIERRIQKAEQQTPADLAVPEAPVGIPESFSEHVKLMFDLQVLAYQCDLTRVITFMIGREFSGRTYPEIGVTEAHHPVSHHQNDPVRMDKVAKINAYHASMFAYYLEKLRSTPDGDGSLLDHMLLLYGAGMSDSNAHDPHDLPLVLAGGGKGGKHIRYSQGTPLANLHLTLLDRLGVPVESIGNSTGHVELTDV